MKTVALLLDDEHNKYQQLLVREAKIAAVKHHFTLLPPEFAAGSSWTQIESINGYLRRTDSRPDALVIVLAGTQLTRSSFERAFKAGMAVVFLNRIPSWVDELRTLFPTALVAGVAPNQEGVGEVQAQQASRLAPAGSFVLLVTGDAASSTAVLRRAGFLSTIRNRCSVHEMDGHWSAEGASQAIGDWFKIGADRDTPVSLVVCQNDLMAQGARASLEAQAAKSGRPELAKVPIIGCDGLEDEGQAMVARGTLAATVVMPPTTPAALETLSRYWESGTRTGLVSLDIAADIASLPPLSQIVAVS
jgi:ABC-type sugar transport system substrate-binding protein